MKRNGMSRSNVRGLVAFSKVFRSDRLTNLIPGYTIPVCLQFPPSSTHRSADVSLFPLVCPLLPSFSSFSPPSPSFFCASVRSRTKRENFKLEKPRSENKGGDDAWEEGNKGSSLAHSFPPSRPLRLALLASATRDEVEVSR